MTDRALWVVVVFAVGCSFAGGSGRDDTPGDSSDAATITADAAPAPDASEPARDPAQPGPWAVGVRTVRLTDPSRSRSFDVDVWFPVDPAHVDGTPNKYKLESLFG